jgi:3-methyladenine DNA glycosylase AlkD
MTTRDRVSDTADGELAALAREMEDQLRGRADAKRREVTIRYFPSKLEILGVSAPELRKVLRTLLGCLDGRLPRDVVEVARHLHRGGTHEGRQLGYELLEGRKDARSLLRVRGLRALGKGNDNWASVDGFSVCVSGPVWREGLIGDGEVLRWAGSPDRWWRRTALVSTVPLNLRSRGGTGDSRRTLAVCEALAEDQDPMVAKALSWALRSLIPHDAASVRRFLKNRKEVLASLVRREVRNKLETGKKKPSA